MPYDIKNPHSTAPSEHISDEQYGTLKAAGKLAGLEVTKVEKPAKPAELTETPKTQPKKADEAK